MKTRKYNGEPDLQLLQQFNAKAISETDHKGYLHTGDIPFHIYNGNKHYDPAELLTIWEDKDGLAAWLLVTPRYKGFDLQVRPDLLANEFSREVLEYAFHQTAEKMAKYDIKSGIVYADCVHGDLVWENWLLELGWVRDNDPPYVLTKMDIPVDLEVALPEGYTCRQVRGIEEASALAEVHNSAFTGAKWTENIYRTFMESPAYQPERELLIEAPDGSLAAFCIIWFDHLNKTGLFEPVGTHKDHQRRGLGRAIISYGIQSMKEKGMTRASVCYFDNNPGAKGLYLACGFKPWHYIDSYSRKI